MTRHKHLLVDKRGYEKESGEHALIAAIIEQAAKDYISAKLWLRDHPKKNKSGGEWKRRLKAESLLKDTESFFRSEWFMWLSDIDAEKLMAALDEEVNRR